MVPLEFIQEVFSKISFEKISYVATATATFFAWRTTSMNKKQSKEQIDEQHRIERPRLVPLNKDVFIHTHGSKHSSLWNIDDPPNDEYTYRYNELDAFYFTLINTGQSFALKIELTFELIGGIDSIEEFKNSKFSVSLNNPELKQLNPESFTFNVQNYMFDQVYTSNFIVDSFKRRFPLLKSNESAQIRLPKYFIELNSLNIFDITQNKPRLKLSINYLDQYHEKHIDHYIIEIKRNLLSVEKNEDNKNIFQKNELFLDFKYVQPADIVHKKKHIHKGSHQS